MGDCDHRDAPCRTLDYALGLIEHGDAIKVGAGEYDFSGLSLEELLLLYVAGANLPGGGVNSRSNSRNLSAR